MDKTLIFFKAPWCAPCKNMSVILDDIIKYYNLNLIIINIDENIELVEEYEIRTIPTLVLKDENGIVIGKVSGLINSIQLKEFLSYKS